MLATELYGSVVTELQVKGPSGYTSFNPSVHFDGKQWRCLVRHSDYRIDPKTHTYFTAKNHGIIRNQASVIELGANLEISKQSLIGGSYVGPSFPGDERGWFDGRLFESMNTLYVIACSKEWNPKGKHEQVLIRLDSEYQAVEFTRLSGKWSDTPQKNWTPFNGEYPIQLIQSIDSGSVLIYAEGNYALHGNWDFAGLRGSSPVINVGDRLIGIAHDMTMKRPSGIKSYRHCFYEIDWAAKKIGQGPWFEFGTGPIEYCAGLGWDGTKLVASFGSLDANCHLAIMNLTEVLKNMSQTYLESVAK